MESLIKAYFGGSYHKDCKDVRITPFLLDDEQHYRIEFMMGGWWDEEVVSVSDLLRFMWENK